MSAVTVPRARDLIAAHHAGRITRRQLAEGLWALYAEEFGEPLAPASGRSRRAAGLAEAASGPPWPRPPAPGIWILVMSDRCHFCGREGIPVVALRADDDDEVGWVHVCLDDLELIRAQVRPLVAGAAPE